MKTFIFWTDSIQKNLFSMLYSQLHFFSKRNLNGNTVPDLRKENLILNKILKHEIQPHSCNTFQKMKQREKLKLKWGRGSFKFRVENAKLAKFGIVTEIKPNLERVDPPISWQPRNLYPTRQLSLGQKQFLPFSHQNNHFLLLIVEIKAQDFGFVHTTNSLSSWSEVDRQQYLDRGTFDLQNDTKQFKLLS